MMCIAQRGMLTKRQLDLFGTYFLFPQNLFTIKNCLFRTQIKTFKSIFFVRYLRTIINIKYGTKTNVLYRVFKRVLFFFLLFIISNHYNRVQCYRFPYFSSLCRKHSNSCYLFRYTLITAHNLFFQFTTRSTHRRLAKNEPFPYR
jgi:hypothetical protein